MKNRTKTLILGWTLNAALLAAACGGSSPDLGEDPATIEDGDDDTEGRDGGVVEVDGGEAHGGGDGLIGDDEPDEIFPAACGDSRLTADEACDDGNAESGDGCDETCAEVERGYVCSGAGVACELTELCGDSRLVGSEQCDDGNDSGGDGCSPSCQLERDYACPVPGEACTYTIACGDGRIGGDEECDDGNDSAEDGCSDACTVEPGYTCSFQGEPCLAICGDGVLLGLETCDDGNSDADDGCSDLCRLEPGFVCDVPGVTCRRAVCGDGIVEAGEPCDDGSDTTLGDGCSPGCSLEPDCSAGECQSRCGDGMTLMGDAEECDDGNNTDGDGCSGDCFVEEGFACETIADADVDQLDLPVVYRDFRGDDLDEQLLEDGTSALPHPDFQSQSGTGEEGLVMPTLAAADDEENVPYKPIYNPEVADESPLFSSKEAFDQWYADVPSVNRTVVDTLTLTAVDDVEGTFEFDDQSFFPIDELGFNDAAAVDVDGEPLEESREACGDEGGQHNFNFTSEVRYWFEYQGGEVLTFRGDDDVWVFIKGRLVVDLGGLHPALLGEIVLDDTAVDTTGEPLDLQPGRVYEIAVFQAERRTCHSSYRLTLAGFTRQRTECQSVCGDGVVAGDELCDDGDMNGQTYGGCGENCRPGPRCGDGVFDEDDEECDNGVNLDGYQVEGLEDVCAPGCVLPPSCGDGVIDPSFGEACDDGENDGSYNGCNADCTLGPRCGDGEEHEDEECDDGNRTNGDGCNVSCVVETNRDAAPLRGGHSPVSPAR